MAFMIEQDTLVRPDETLRAETDMLKSVIDGAVRGNAQSVFTVQRLEANNPSTLRTVATAALPDAVSAILQAIVDNLSKGKAVAMVSFSSRLTTHQASKFLGVSRPYLIKLLEADKIPYEKVGSHRRIQLEDVIKYRDEQKQSRRNALDEMTRVTQEEEPDYMGKNFTPPEPDDE
jgi:excisionase family DNA binding protein